MSSSSTSPEAFDAPRVALWQAEDELENEEESDEHSSDSGDSSLPEDRDMASLEGDLSSLPLGALRKAREALAQIQPETDSEQSIEKDGAVSQPMPAKLKPKPEWDANPRKDIVKRSNKHAPTEVTSKRPVTRRRQVVEVKKLHSRDPRFTTSGGEFSPANFNKQYGFLQELRKSELQTLRESLTRARRLLATSPRALVEERQAELNRLELALKRKEAEVNRDKRERIESEALNKVTKEERIKRKEGKGEWWMKNSEKKKLLVRARYDVLASSGGQSAVKKAIEKKRKKTSQKEKRNRPFARREGAPDSSRNEVGSRKRTAMDEKSPREKKRTKLI